MMHRLLLNSSLSDQFDLGARERFIPMDPDLESRVIRFRTDLITIDPSKRDMFFRRYSDLELPGRMTRAIAEFFLEEFFEKLKREGFSVKYFEGEPYTRIETANYICEFKEDGRRISVYTLGKLSNGRRAKGNGITNISRLVEVRKGLTRLIVVCDPRASRDPQTKFNARIKVAKELGQYRDISYLLVYARDSFKFDAKRSYSQGYERAPSIEEYLQRSPYNLLLVYSSTVAQLDKIGRQILAKIQ